MKLTAAETRRLVTFIETAAGKPAAVFRANVPRATLSAWRKGRRPTKDRIQALLRVAGVTWKHALSIPAQGMAAPWQPAHLQTAWKLAARLHVLLGVPIRVSGSTDSNKSWLLRLSGTEEVAVTPAGVMEFYYESRLVASSDAVEAFVRALSDRRCKPARKTGRKTVASVPDIKHLQKHLSDGT